MLGIDITKVSRFKNSKKSFVLKILHPNEVVKYEDDENKNLFLAVRWAIKEAIYKADNSYFHFNKIEIIKVDNKYTFNSFDISTSSEGNYIIAAAIKRR